MIDIYICKTCRKKAEELGFKVVPTSVKAICSACNKNKIATAIAYMNNPEFTESQYEENEVFILT